MDARTTTPSRRLYRVIADQIVGRITSGEFNVGDYLPSERDLAIQHRVSRPTIREAIIALEVLGIVEVRIGTGIFVLRLPDRAPDAGPVNGAAGEQRTRLQDRLAPSTESSRDDGAPGSAE